MTIKPSRIKSGRYAALAGVSLFIFALFFLLLPFVFRQIGSRSVELGYASPVMGGPAGGLVIPASCESGAGEGGVAHWIGDNSGSCPASTCVPNLGAACTGPVNVCGSWHDGTVQCDGSCTARRPADPPNYGSICNSPANNCGRVNSGTIDCGNNQDGTHCSATAPANDTLPCGAPYFLKVCENSCASGIQHLNGSILPYFDNSPARNFVACFSTVADCSDVNPAANITGSAIWIESGANAVTVSGTNPKTVTPILQGAPGTVSEQLSVAYGGSTITLTMGVTKFGASGCTSDQDAATCNGTTYGAPSPTPGCGAVINTCTGNRTCDFNWKEVGQ